MEMSDIAQAMFHAFSRGSSITKHWAAVPHLHWWLTPRYDDDSRPRAPIWEDFDFLRNPWAQARPDDERGVLKRTLPAR
jgi:diadenosine tetraphosphate (Ap4A) HIT family hydrolase